MAWHWIDQKKGLAKAFELLKPDGCIALFWNEVYRVWPSPKALTDIRAICDRYFPSNTTPGRPLVIKTDFIKRTEEFLFDHRFEDVDEKTYITNGEEYDANRLLSYFRSFSDIYHNPSFRYDEFADEVYCYINKQGGKITLPMIYHLIIAKRRNVKDTIEYIPREKIEGIIDLDDYVMNPNIVDSFFLHGPCQILYLYNEKSGELGGVVTPMDLIRYRSKKSSMLFNPKYVYLTNKSKERARRVFSTKKNIHEIPVLIDGKFVGVYKDISFNVNSIDMKKMRNMILKYSVDEYVYPSDLFMTLSFSKQKELLEKCFHKGVIEMYMNSGRI